MIIVDVDTEFCVFINMKLRNIILEKKNAILKKSQENQKLNDGRMLSKKGVNQVG